MRKLAEALATEPPLVLVFEDVHWGEPTLLDLIEHLADWARDAPVLLVCLARPELLDGRPGWGGGKLNATAILLEPLSRHESGELVEKPRATASSPRPPRRIAEAAEGNPLFLEQMLAMLAEDEELGGGARRAAGDPGAARRPARPPRPRGAPVLERASVEGEVFHGRRVAELAPTPSARAVDAALLSPRPQGADPPRPRRICSGERAFRFRHVLIRDAAYEAMPKEARAELHERYAAWLEQRGRRAAEYEEILGYHLEQAYRYRAELGRLEETRALGDAPPGGWARPGTARSSAATPAAMNLIARDRDFSLTTIPCEWGSSRTSARSRAQRRPRLGRDDPRGGDRVGRSTAPATHVVQRGFLRLFTEPDVRPVGPGRDGVERHPHAHVAAGMSSASRAPGG